MFLQWIDSVYQLLVQFPRAFEFSSRFLLALIDHTFACRYGTFLYNSQQERQVSTIEGFAPGI